jgi:hypothetical protein
MPTQVAAIGCHPRMAKLRSMFPTISGHPPARTVAEQMTDPGAKNRGRGRNLRRACTPGRTLAEDGGTDAACSESKRYSLMKGLQQFWQYLRPLLSFCSSFGLRFFRDRGDPATPQLTVALVFALQAVLVASHCSAAAAVRPRQTEAMTIIRVPDTLSRLGYWSSLPSGAAIGAR